jgi:glutathionylspermidine synthase
MELEEALIHQLPLAKGLHLPLPLRKALPRLAAYKAEQNIRLMRFDFHPIETGWAVSEVNSDVPGGLAEGSVLPEIAKGYIDGCPGENVAEHLLKAFRKKVKNGTIVFVHATSYSDDRQVMQFLGDYFKENGFNSVYAAPDHIKWIDGKAVCKVNGEECLVDGIVRFFPLEWLINLPRRTAWQGYFDSQTPSCNNPAALFAQSVHKAPSGAQVL